MDTVLPNVITESLSKFFHNQSDYNTTINTLKKYFLYSLDTIKLGHNFDYNINEYTTNYPRYPYPYPMIQALRDFNILKIQTVDTGGINDLTDSISDTAILSRKVVFDKYPTNYLGLYHDYSFQCACFTDIDTLFDMNIHHSLHSESLGKNYYGRMFNEDLNSPISNVSYMFVYLLYQMLCKNIASSNSLISDLTENIFLEDNIGTPELKTGFSTFITDNKATISKDLVKTYLKCLYNFVVYDDKISTKLSKSLYPVILQLSGLFNTFIDKYHKDPMYSILNEFIPLFTNKLSIDLLQDIYTDDDCVYTDRLSYINTKEIDTYTAFKNSIDYYPIKDYMILSYIYKQYPEKFLNVLTLNVKSFIEEKVKTDSVSLFSKIEYSNNINNILNSGFNYTNLAEYLNTTITESLLTSTITNSNIHYLACFKYFSKLADNFVEYLMTEEYPESVLRNIFNTLRSSGLVSYDYNWYQHTYITKLYFQSLFKYHIFNNNLFHNVSTLFVSSITNTIRSYAISNNFTVEKLKTNFKQQVIANTSNISTFMENLFLSTLTKEVIYDHLSFYLI